MILVLFGTIGVVWAIVWHRWFRDDPAQHPSVNAAELEYILAGREADTAHGAGRDYWRRLATHRNTFALCLMYFPNSYAFDFCITWLPTYLKEKQGLTNIARGLCRAADGLQRAGRLVRRRGDGLGRRPMGSARGTVRPGVCGLPGGRNGCDPRRLFSATVGSRRSDLPWPWQPACSRWGRPGTCLDIGGNHAGVVVSAAMNTSGQIGSMISPVLAITLVKTFGDRNAPLCLIGVLFFAVLCWCFVDPRRRIFGSDAK